MKKRLMNIMVMCFAVLFAFSFIGCSNTAQKVPPHKTFDQTIQENPASKNWDTGREWYENYTKENM
ncbi:hypothetical protein [Clostridium sp.]|uniref:hypothetical protein n=1 Tax=Clostridium sp. TaxID=1506 RepID=UPI003D6D485E